MMQAEEKPDMTLVLEHFGAETVPDGHGWRAMRCPFHDDSHASASVNTGEGVFTCHACGVKGDSLAVIQAVQGVPFLAAKAYAAANIGWQERNEPKSRAQRRPARRWTPPGRRGRAHA